jgi:EAL domain-containing protein (putative c-di-GMP-specific phosphodiesterase class I)
VESEVSAQRLAELDCDELQGFHFARAMPPEEVAAWVEQHGANVEAYAASVLPR